MAKNFFAELRAGMPSRRDMRKMFESIKAVETNDQNEITKTEEIVFRACPTPPMGGQIWESCRCGREPIYMPLGVCEKCWPR